MSRRPGSAGPGSRGGRPKPTRPTSPALWFAMFGAVSAYAAHLVAAFWFAPLACVHRLEAALHWGTAAALVVAGASTAVAVGLHRRLRPRVEPPAGPRRSLPAASRAYLAALLLRRARPAMALLALAAARDGAVPAPAAQRRDASPPRAAFMARSGVHLGWLSVALLLLSWGAVVALDPCT